MAVQLEGLSRRLGPPVTDDLIEKPWRYEDSLKGQRNPGIKVVSLFLGVTNNRPQRLEFVREKGAPIGAFGKMIQYLFAVIGPKKDK